MNCDVPFPQANDFEKVMAIINIDLPENLLSYSKVGLLLGNVSDRQVSYYVAAAQYLNILSKDKTFTAIGNKIRDLVGVEQYVEIAKLIISDEVFGTVYFTQKMLGLKLDVEDIVEIMKQYVALESDAVYKRRASTVTAWIDWINEKEIA